MTWHGVRPPGELRAETKRERERKKESETQHVYTPGRHTYVALVGRRGVEIDSQTSRTIPTSPFNGPLQFAVQGMSKNSQQ